MGCVRLAFVVFILAGAVACSADEKTSQPTGTATASAGNDGQPKPVGTIPEGVLLVQKEAQSPPPIFGIAAGGEVRRYERGFVLRLARRHIAGWQRSDVAATGGRV